MATVIGQFRPGLGAIVLKLYAPGSSTVVNTGGDAGTEGVSTRYSFEVGEDLIAGEVYEAVVELPSSGGAFASGGLYVEAGASELRLTNLADAYAAQAMADLSGEVLKIPRAGQSHEWTRVSGDSSSDVVAISEAS